MTAEVAIMNRQAVALAADSAVTVNFPHGQKIYNSVNKLFMLSKYAPVGIMIYGAADLTGMPWETIIKCFRRELGEKRLPHLREYADYLIDYVNGHKFLFSEGNQEQQFLASLLVLFRSILGDIEQKMTQAIAQRGPLDDRAIRSIVTGVIREAHSAWTSAKKLPGVPGDYAERIRQKWPSQIDAVISFVFEKLPITSNTRSRLIEIAGLVFAAALFPDNVSGVVVAGFGDEEYLPSVVSFDMEGVLLDFVKVQESEARSAAINDSASAAIIPFAQREMVNLFMEGVDRRFWQEIGHALTDFVAGMADELVTRSNITGRRETILRNQINQVEESLTKKFFDRLKSYTDVRHVEPVVSAVTNLPKEELASMAESLVSLTSFKRRVTYDPETVGGPIDVAVISKGDGFIWIRRKHYFDPGLNPHFLANYYRA